MKKETVLVIVVALIVGLLAGVIITSPKGGSSSSSSGSANVSAPAVNTQQQVQLLETMVKNDPQNIGAWLQLGHHYFDTSQPVKAIEAYNKVLEVDPNNPDVLTDQGVMFRRLGWFDKAVENFTKAHDISPGHKQSLFNLGVVYRYDLQDLDKATLIWKKYLNLFPSDPSSEKVKLELEFLEAQPGTPKG